MTKYRNQDEAMNNKILRGKIDGETKYCRIPIRRKRTPIAEYDIEDIASYQERHNLTDEQMNEKAADIADMGDTYWAGKIYSYLDAKSGDEFLLIDTVPARILKDAETEKALKRCESNDK